ncbi:tetratricopeptide repeat-containing glycosyltransferase family 2 protein [Fonticella tunisiensis]|uniref:Glycosyltransferase involved in cell wall biosynthesis n=1 Tax=Fonticella tunisiensis TaxID=1096341 RepID=A0A4R7KLF9_9CLOT|nr:glycosyltransferase [Fonticella tunisiensis]TDT57236.1 glycosyltransferase involved in cell wall biosynthesis [Fonticella tunisiensis]
MKLSLCMIVKNEEKFIKMCLDNSLPLVDEAIIVDTGSTDNTREIIKSFDNKVRLIETKWENDFSKARNLSIENATGDWILVLDADEKLVATDKLRKYIEKCHYEGIRIPFYHVVNDGDILYTNVYAKIFRNKYRYSGRIHEQVRIEADKIVDVPEDIAKIYHFGYLKKVYESKNKLNRNLTLLKDEYNKDPNNPFILYNLGVTCFSEGNYEESLKYFFKCNEQLNYKYANQVTFYEFDILNRIPSILNRLKKYDDCIIFLEGVTGEINNIPDLYFNLGEAYEGKGDLEKAIEAYKKCIEIGENRDFVSVKGIGSFYPKFKIAKIYEKKGEIMKAASMYIEGVFDKNNILRKGINETREFLERNKLYEILIEFNSLIKNLL